jgi:hypothetical protein
MNTTYVKWNTEKPKFEDVKGKWIFMEWINERHSNLQTDILMSNTQREFEANFEGMVRYAILSDEPVYCEWTNKGAYWQGCGGQWSLVYKFCPHCGNPIKVIDELKPLPLMGIEPEIVCQEGSDGHLWKYQWRLNETYITSDAFFSKREAIESWNLLVKKLTGEK